MKLEVVVKNIDARLARVEHYLPKLATRKEPKELKEAMTDLPTRNEMRAAIRAEGEASRRHADVLFETLRHDNRMIVDHLMVVTARLDALARR